MANSHMHPGKLSSRVRNIPEAATLTMAARARALREQGVSVVNLTIGEPNFDTPAAIKQAAFEAMQAGHTKYPPVIGLPELRQAASDKFKRDNALDYTPDEIVISNGGKQAIVNACMAVLNAGDEAILMAPFWAAYSGSVAFAGAVPVVIPTNVAQNFKITPDQLENAITARTRLVFLNSPGNPSGAVYSHSELEDLAAVIARHQDITVLADEIYEQIIFEGGHASFAALPGMKQRTITINGVSKAFAMTGWRIGYTGAPRNLVPYLVKVQGMLTAGANPFAQLASAFALNNMADETKVMRDAYLARRDVLIAGLSGIDGITIARPQGAFYAFPDISAFYGRKQNGQVIENSADFSNFLLDEARVSSVPGRGFGDDRCIRLSFAAGMDEVKEAIVRIGHAVRNLT